MSNKAEDVFAVGVLGGIPVFGICGVLSALASNAGKLELLPIWWVPFCVAGACWIVALFRIELTGD